MSRPRAKFSGGASGRRAEVLRAIAAADGLTTAERCVLFVIEAHVGYADRDTGWCHPAIATIGAAAGMSERQAFRVVARLRVLGWVEVKKRSERGSQTTSRYRVRSAPEPATASAEEPTDEDPRAVH